MPIIKRLQDSPYRWKVEAAALSKIANVEKVLPKSFISKDGFGITDKGKKYFKPLIGGQNKEMKQNARYLKPKCIMVAKKLSAWR